MESNTSKATQITIDKAIINLNQAISDFKKSINALGEVLNQQQKDKLNMYYLQTKKSILHSGSPTSKYLNYSVGMFWNELVTLTQ